MVRQSGIAMMCWDMRCEMRVRFAIPICVL